MSFRLNLCSSYLQCRYSFSPLLICCKCYDGIPRIARELSLKQYFMTPFFSPQKHSQERCNQTHKNTLIVHSFKWPLRSSKWGSGVCMLLDLLTANTMQIPLFRCVLWVLVCFLALLTKVGLCLREDKLHGVRKRRLKQLRGVEKISVL